MPSRRTHIEPSACVCILALLKRIVPSIILNIMVVWACAIEVEDRNIPARGKIAVSRHGVLEKTI